MTDVIRCTGCHAIIVDGEGRYNYPTGVKCNTCGDPKLNKKKKTKFVEIEGYKVPTKLLEAYRDKVELTRLTAKKGLKENDPLIVMQALQDRTEFHAKILNIAGLKHDDMTEKAMKIRKALDDWLEENILIKPQIDGLV